MKNKTKAAVLADHADPNTLYVMPPQAGSASLSNAFYSANTGFCSEMRDLQGTSKLLGGEIKRIALKLKGHEAELEKLRRQKAAYDKEAAKYYEDPLVQQVSGLEFRISDTEERIDDLRERLAECETQACTEDLQEDIRVLKQERSNLKAELARLSKRAGENLRQYKKLTKQAEAVALAMDDIYAQHTKALSQIVTLKGQIIAMYDSYAKLEGGHSSITFNTRWDASVEQLRRENDGFNVMKLPTQNVNVNISMLPGAGDDSQLASAGTMFRGYTVNGVKFDPNKPTLTLPAHPEMFQATVFMTLLSACPQLHPEYFDIPKGQQGLPLYGLTAAYEYPSTFLTHVKASYNLWKIYEYMKKVSVHGGFFSTSSKTEVFETNQADSGFTLQWFDDSGMTEEQRNAIVREIKLELMFDVMRMMGVPTYDAASKVNDPPPPPASGAVVLAEGVQSTCGWYSFYCGGVAWFLKGLNAIFGSTETETQFRQSYNYQASREYRTDRILYRPGVTVFEKDALDASRPR
ncbi:hypothetical protein ATI61_111187 [Archangium gephyra]|uniref:Uncharacterized protein n=1 Tax=Archangium gephyra TaxID=48 RepID=A0AAC8TIF4_9BACT|nr:hypothetical protein [Archangium gephyra]AKJ07228.1 Hypothetical protein AA314_08854 [Archangium gephyra]REG26637.1 hypothetical protein ATI61_111187 [Archangium gephyra]